MYAPLLFSVTRPFILIGRLPILLYLVDAFHFAASATAAGSVSSQVMTLTVLFLTILVLRSDVSLPVRLCIPAVRPTNVSGIRNWPGEFCTLSSLPFWNLFLPCSLPLE